MGNMQLQILASLVIILPVVLAREMQILAFKAVMLVVLHAMFQGIV